MSDIDIRKEGRAGRITLNRPQALNALNHPMALQIDAALDDWADDPAVALVLIDAAGGKAFCAGGDIQDIYHKGRAGDLAPVRAFWRDEYPLNCKIFHYPKPYVALIDGIDMGGGVGISCHGSHRIVGDNALIAMPECSIGLIPDVGVSLILARHGALGRYLALTGYRMRAADAIHAGFADRHVPSDRFADLTGALVEEGDVAAIDRFAGDPGTAPLAEAANSIDALFSAGSPADIEAALEAAIGAEDGGWCADTLKALRRASPISAFSTLAVIDAVRTAPSIEEAVRREFRFTFRSISDGDLLEGIRAAVIDKDRTPNWQHPGFSAVSSAEVEAITGDLGEDELKF